MSKGPSNENEKRSKMESSDPKRTRVRININGTVRKNFYGDCLKKGISESNTGEMILKIHYALVDAFPLLSGFEYADVKKMDQSALKRCIIDKIKFT